MDDLRTAPRRHAFCTACGAPLVDGECTSERTGGCTARALDDSIEALEASLGKLKEPSAPVDHDALAASTEEPAEVHQPVRAPRNLPADMRSVPTREVNANPSHRYAFGRVLLGVVGVLVTAALVTGLLAYRDLDRQVRDLQVALHTSAQRDEATGERIDGLLDQLAGLSTEVNMTKSQLDKHPATAKVAKQSAPSVFTIYTDAALGSGWVVSSDGATSELLTNYHVVKDDYRTGDTSVEVRRRGESYPGEIVDVSEANDLAVIRVHHALPALTLHRNRARVGDPVLVLGSPNGLGGTVTSGIVSAYRTLDAIDYLQFSAPISPGNSGGPVLDETGKVLGVAVMKDVHDYTEGISYAIPTARVCEALDVC